MVLHPCDTSSTICRPTPAFQIEQHYQHYVHDIEPPFSPKGVELLLHGFRLSFSPSLLLNNVARSSLYFGNPVICTINLVSIDTGGSSHNCFPWMQLSSNLTQALISRICPKWGISNRFNIPDFSSLISHICDSSSISCALVVSWHTNIFPF
jgi:hypothetical protein